MALKDIKEMKSITEKIHNLTRRINNIEHFANISQAKSLTDFKKIDDKDFILAYSNSEDGLVDFSFDEFDSKYIGICYQKNNKDNLTDDRSSYYWVKNIKE